MERNFQKGKITFFQENVYKKSLAKLLAIEPTERTFEQKRTRTFSQENTYQMSSVKYTEV